MVVYRSLGALLPTRSMPPNPARILFVRPCCIGDVILATAALKALRRGYPDAHITWAVGGWSRQAVARHDLIDAVLDTGPDALPVKSVAGMRRFVRDVRARDFDLAVSLVRSPLMSAALLLSGIPHRAGIDSAGRGFGYTLRVPVDPQAVRHEAEIYLDVVRALGLDTTDCYANVPIHAEDRAAVQALDLPQPYIVVHPAGGRNPGMTLDVKRWPPEHFAALANRLASRLNAGVVLLGGPGDLTVVGAVKQALMVPAQTYVAKLSFGQIAALAVESLVYIGNDTGMTHLAAAAGAKTAMILGPTDPNRYAPFTPDSLALWKPRAVSNTGVAGGAPSDWDWARDGIGVDEAAARILAFVE